MTLPPPLRPSFWFDPAPPPLMHSVEVFLVVLFILFAVVGIMSRLALLRSGWEKWTKKMVDRASVRFMVLGFTGLMLYFFSYERAYVLSMRLWYGLWGALLLGYAWTMYRYTMIEIPKLREREAQREQISKWLPKAKK